MKKLFGITLLIATLGIGATACKKTYNCDCVVVGFSDTTQREAKGKTDVEACDEAEQSMLGENCFPAE